LSTRKISLKTCCLSGDRLMTQLEITTSTLHGVCMVLVSSWR
jgi:hypothetical protein